MKTGDIVYVRSFARAGQAEVVRPSKGYVRVRWPDDTTSTHARSVVQFAAQPIQMATVLSRPSTTAAELAPVEKPATDRDSRYLRWIRSQPCAWSGAATVEASHHPEQGGGSMAMKCSDYRTLPLAPTVHRQFTDHQRIGNMDAEQTRAWTETQITRHLARYIRERL